VVTFDLNWRTSTVVALARSIYECRDYGPMPLLADAIQDAGCENEDILNHCRSAGPHVRGYWVVDLVLRKNEYYLCSRSHHLAKPVHGARLFVLHGARFRRVVRSHFGRTCMKAQRGFVALETSGCRQ
jgi:hypothetical protein